MKPVPTWKLILVTLALMVVLGVFLFAFLILTSHVGAVAAYVTVFLAAWLLNGARKVLRDYRRYGDYRRRGFAR